MKTLSLASVLALFALGSAAPAATFNIMIGDDDGFGEGVADNGVATGPIGDFGVDNRSAAEQAATDGAEQTDINSAFYAPVANPAQFIFSLPGTITSAVLTLDIGGLQKDVFGETLAYFNGTLKSGLLAITEADYRASRVLTFSLTVAELAAANSAGFFKLSLDRNGNNDAVFIDYVKLSGTYEGGGVSPVPLPAGLPLLAAGLGALGLVRRRRA